MKHTIEYEWNQETGELIETRKTDTLVKQDGTKVEGWSTSYTGFPKEQVNKIIEELTAQKVNFEQKQEVFLKDKKEFESTQKKNIKKVKDLTKKIPKQQWDYFNLCMDKWGLEKSMEKNCEKISTGLDNAGHALKTIKKQLNDILDAMKKAE